MAYRLSCGRCWLTLACLLGIVSFLSVDPSPSPQASKKLRLEGVSEPVRRSSRPRRAPGAKPLHVASTDTLRDLKVQVSGGVVESSVLIKNHQNVVDHWSGEGRSFPTYWLSIIVLISDIWYCEFGFYDTTIWILLPLRFNNDLDSSGGMFI